jgi:hypothetical protein
LKFNRKSFGPIFATFAFFLRYIALSTTFSMMVEYLLALGHPSWCSHYRVTVVFVCWLILQVIQLPGGRELS